MRSGPSGQLNRKDTHSPGSAMDQNSLARFQVRPVKQSLPRRQGTDGDDCCFRMTQSARLYGD